MEKVEGLWKIEFKELWFLATKESYFIFNRKFSKQVNGFVIGSPLGPTLANAFLGNFEKNWPQNFPSDFRPYYYRQHVDDIFVLFDSPKHLEAFRNFLNGWHANMSFTIESEKQNRMSFLDVQISPEDKYLPTLSTVNPPLVEFIHILTAFYHLPGTLVLFTHSLIDAYEFPQFGLNCTMN